MAAGTGVRPAGHLYTLHSHPSYRFWTGVGAAGRQTLARGLSGVVVSFDRDGRLVGVEERPSLGEEGEVERWLAAAGVVGGPIRVERFEVPGHRTRIEDLPAHLVDFRRDPSHPSFMAEEREAYSGDIAKWLATGQFVYHADEADFFVAPNGEVVAS